MDYPAPEKKPGEDQVLDVNVDTAATASDDVLDVTLDDDDTDSSAYPEVTTQQQQAGAAAVLLECLCSSTGRGFEVQFEEQEPGVYYATQVRATGKSAAASAGKGGEGLAQIQGAFRLGPEFACPCCGSRVLSACEACQTVLCGGGADRRARCACPGCGTGLTLSGQAVSSARGVGGGKKKWMK